MLSKHFYSTLFFLLCCGSGLLAQSATFELPNVTAQPGETVCLPVTVLDFTDISQFGFTLTWNDEALSFQSINNINPALNNFGQVNEPPGQQVQGVNTLAAAGGIITAYWQRWAENADCGDLTSGLTLDDDAVLFEVCLNVVGSGFGDIQPVNFFNAPQELVVNKWVRAGLCTEDAILATENGSVTEGVDPLIMSVVVPDGNFQPGDLICVDIIAESGFLSMVGLQFGLDWDKDFMQVESVIPNEDIPQNFSYNVDVPGNCFSTAWSYTSITEPQSITLTPGTVFAQACFRITGDCNEQTSISITENCAGAPVEATNLVNDVNRRIPVVTNDDQFRTSFCNTRGLDVVANCGSPVEVGQTVCVEVQAGANFQSIEEFEYLINFDPTILSYSNVQGFNSALGMNGGDFDNTNAGNGVLQVDWASSPFPPVSVNNGATLYEVCFDVIGYAPLTPITFSNGRVEESQATPSLIGIDPQNCEVNIIQPDRVIMSFGSGNFSSSNTDCIPVTVSNFQEINNLNFTISFDANGDLFDFQNVQNNAIPDATITPTGGLIFVSYTGDPVTLADGSVLFEICLQAKDDAVPNECSPIDLVELVPPTASNPDNTIGGIISTGGEGCVLFPEGFGLEIGTVTMGIDSAVCIPVTVVSFDNITGADFSISFPPQFLTYQGISLTGGWPGLDFDNIDITNNGTGLLNFSWTNPTPIVIPDGTVVFDLCLNTLSTPGCYNIEAFSSQEPSATTSMGNGSILFTDGQVCVEDRIKVSSRTVVEPSCPGVCNGKMVIEAFAGGENAGNFFIRLDNPLQTRAVGDTLRNLCPGWNYYTIYNTGDPELTLRDSIFIEFDDTQVVTAQANMDQTLGCSVNNAVSLGSQGNQGETFDLFRVSGENLSFVTTGDINPDGSFTYFTSIEGTYLLEVINAAGCSAFDTVRVFSAERPAAIAGADTSLTCDVSQIVLSGEGSTTGGITTYRWERLAGGEVVDTVGTELELIVTEAGRYRLTVTNPQTQCSTSDDVIIADGGSVPSISLPFSASLGCDGSPALLDAGPAEDGLTYTWRDSGGNLVSATTMYMADAIGEYTLTVVNTATNCSASQTVVVSESEGAPVIADPGTFSLNCFSDTLQLNLDITGVSGSTTYSWSTEDGRIVIGQQDLPNPEIFGAGSYSLTVDNGGCTATTTVVVGESVPPVASAGDDAPLDCATGLVLDGSGSSGESLAFLWFTNGDTIQGANTDQVMVSSPGTYVLEVTASTTGCTATDTVEVLAPVGLPEIMVADTVLGLSCLNGMISVTPTVAQATNFALDITGPGAPSVDPNDPNSVLVTEAGVHTLSVTNTDNGCTSTAEFLVDDELLNPPFAALTRSSDALTCESPNVLVDGRLSSQGDDISYEWTGLDGGEVIDSTSNDSLVVRTGGTYVLTVTNNATGCVDTDTISISDDRVFPVVDTLPVAALTCEDRNRTLAITIPDTTGLSIQWFGAMGLIASNVLTVDINDGGTYSVVVADIQSSCVTTETIQVEDEADNVQAIDFAPVDPFDCSSETVTIDASASLDNPDDVDMISWSSLNGNAVTPPNGSLIVNVDGAGGYVLTLSTTTGCSVSDTIFVDAADNTPLADAGEDMEIECGEMPSLGGMNTSEPSLDTFVYSWIALDGGEILSGGDAPMAIGNGTGQYVLTVTNIYNMCESTDTVSVDLLQQASAQLPADFTTCDETASVTGNLPGGSTGAWTVLGSSTATFTADGATASIAGLTDDISLVYTLSAPGCEDYSSDTITVSREEAPRALDDDLFIDSDGFGSINVLTNDQRNGPVTVNLLDTIPFGQVTFLNGDFSFEAGVGESGSFSVRYEICSNTCGTCDEGVLDVVVDASGERPAVYNAITPNGDGMNETLIFDVLNQGEEFPNNELIIFNRWGDILYEAAPYTNDWDGRNRSGQEIPEGTYYYILRLNLGEGDIIRGDITIIR